MDGIKLEEIRQLVEKNNKMLEKVVAFIDKVENEEHQNKRSLHDFINNVVADLFADMLLQPKGRGHVDKDFINEIITKIK